MQATTPAVSAIAASRAAVHQWDQAADGWHRHSPVIRTWLRHATDAMLNMAHVSSGMRVLDVAAGAGDQTRDIATRIGSAGSVVATDVSPAILRHVDTENADIRAARTEVQVADGEALPFDDASFDAVVCRLGLMLFEDPARGVQEMSRVLRPGGWACTIVFSRPERNPCIATLMRTALRHAGLPPRDPFQPGGLLSLGQPGRVDALFQNAGLRDVATTAVAAPFALRSVDDYIEFVKDAAGPVRDVLGSLAAEAAEAAWADIKAQLRAFDVDGGWCGPNELLLTAGRRPLAAAADREQSHRCAT